jgi:BTB/POZ domain-containing protein 7
VWVRCGSKGIYTKPRLFMPYYEEAKAGVLLVCNATYLLTCFFSPLLKALLEEQLVQVQENEVVRLRMMPSAIPDTLYMVSEYACRSSPHLCHRSAQPSLNPQPVSLDVIAGTIPGECQGISV